jgi:hypothetical protein
VAAGALVYSGEIERHWIEITHREVSLSGLPAAFDGFRIAQLSDIHFDEFTEPFFLRDAVTRINAMKPDAVMLTGDFVTESPFAKNIFKDAAAQCAEILTGLECKERYAVLGNHDIQVGRGVVGDALGNASIKLLVNEYLPVERGGSRFWLAGLDDPVNGEPKPERAIPAAIRSRASEPIVVMCHAPDFVDNMMRDPAGQTAALMLSGHTHGGQIRLPLIGPLVLPTWGKKYVEGWFRFGQLQLHVNRGLGTVGVPLRLDCPPEISLLTLRAA